MFKDKELFHYMGYVAKDVLEKLSDEELIIVMQDSKSKKYDLLRPYLTQDEFWADICQSRLHMKPFQNSKAKTFFQAEILFKRQEYLRAAELNSFNALFHLHNISMAKKDYNAALVYSNKIAMHYGIVGKILGLVIYKEMIESGSVEKVAEALSYLITADQLRNNEGSNYYFQLFNWEPTIGNLDDYLSCFREEFESYQSASAFSLK